MHPKDILLRLCSKKRIGFGRASHIRAASYKGPRADTEYTPEQLRAAENRVHMCANCADLIDKDARRFPIEDLEEMQTTAEKNARNGVLHTNQYGARISADQTSRLKRFISHGTTAGNSIRLANEKHDEWKGFWPYRDFDFTKKLCTSCIGIRNYDHEYCSGIDSLIDIQIHIIKELKSLIKMMDKIPWMYEDYPNAKYFIYFIKHDRDSMQEARISWEKANACLNNIFHLLEVLTMHTKGGSNNSRY